MNNKKINLKQERYTTLIDAQIGNQISKGIPEDIETITAAHYINSYSSNFRKRLVLY